MFYYEGIIERTKDRLKGAFKRGSSVQNGSNTPTGCSKDRLKGFGLSRGLGGLRGVQREK